MSKLLMGALVVLSVGVFSSCKDYDDEINEHKTQISALQAQVDALQQAKTELETKLANANSAIQAAQADATKALNDLVQAKKDLEKAIKDGDDATIAEAQKRIDEANAKVLEAAEKKATELANAAALKAKTEMLAELTQKANELDAAIKLRLTEEEIRTLLKDWVSKDEINGYLEPLITRISKLETTTADMSKQLDELFNDQVKRAVRLDEFKTALADLETKIMAAVDAKYLTITKFDEFKNSEFAAVKASLEQAVAQVNINKSAIETLTNDLGKLDGRVEEVEKAINKLATKKEVEDLELRLTQLINTKASQEDLDNAVEAINATIATLATKAELNTEVGKINGVLEELRGLIMQRATIEQLNAAKTEIKNWVNEQGFQTEDDVKAITDALEATLAGKIQAAKSELEGKIGLCETKADATTKFNTLKQLIDKCATKTELEGVKTELTNTMNGISQSVNSLTTRVQGMEDQFTAMANELNQLAADLEGLFTENEDNVPSEARAAAATTTNSGIAALKRVIEAMSNNIDQLYSIMNGTFAQVQEKLDNIVLFTNKNVTSLVTKPSAWLYGIPRIDADILDPQNTYEFAGFKKSAQGSNYAARNGYEDPFDMSKNVNSHAVDLTAYYWVNPSTITKEKLLNEYSFDMDEIPTKNTITRADPSNRSYDPAGVKDVRATEYKDGILTVKFNFEKPSFVNDAKTIGERIAGTNKETFAWITTVALRATRTNVEGENELGLDDNRIVTSDYSVVAPNYITRLILGNSKYADKGHADEGNKKWHLWTSYPGIVGENFTGVYSFEMNLKSTEVIDLNEYIDTHSFSLNEEGNEVEATDTWDYAKITEKGYDYKYTLLETEKNKGVWKQEGSKFSIAEGKGISANTGFDGAAIVRVELVDKDNKDLTFAYGYVSILMENDKTELKLEMPELRLDCEGAKMENGDLIGDVDFTTGLAWADVTKKIEEALGSEIDWTLCDFVFAEAEAAGDPTVGPETPTRAKGTSQITTPKVLKKFKVDAPETEDTEHLGTLTYDAEADKFVWSFTHAEALEAFYEEDGITPKEDIDYTVIVKIEPNEAGQVQGVAPIIITVSIADVIFPTAGWGFDQRLMGNWYLEQQKDIALEHGPQQYEIHASVEVIDEVKMDENGKPTTTKTDDQFAYDMSVTFRKNTFTVLPDNGFVYKDLEADPAIDYNVKAYFDSDKYYVKPADLAEGAEIKDYPATSTAIGAKGDLYLLYLKDPLDTKLMAIKAEGGKFLYKNPQVVVELSGTDDEKNIGNYIATFQKFAYYDGMVKDEQGNITAGNAKDYAYAYDLLNAAAHSQLAPIESGKDKGKMTFTTHMILRVTDYCLPVKYIDEGNKFDIRYLRPISINDMDGKVVKDAIDGAFDEEGNLNLNHQNVIHLADLVSFIDWRDVPFTSKNGMKYLNYYGVKSINPNLDEAMCDLDHLNADGTPGQFEYIREVSDKIQFTHVTIGESEPTPDRTYEQFREDVGYFLYQNHQSTTETFHIKLPITIVYHWGETASKDVIITVERTKANARVK